MALTINIAGEELQTADKQVGIRKQLQLSLAEKNVLIREIHHRVKNNMQVITSLLALQANKVKDKHVHEEFQYIQFRINSMAMVHEMLYAAGDLAYIDYEKYLNQLVTTLVVSMKGSDGNITSHVDAKSIKLNIDTAIPLGLLINELITNSLKHAFPDGRKGRVSVVIKSCPDHYELKVSDNGIGFPEDFDSQNSTSLGLGLVDTLTIQLEGTLIRENTKGVSYMLTFKQLEANAL
ncbi:MAG TPA: sensor histidine kinase [Phycisphaerales bacterium]|nr:sensor histidine kinase [Phycisphaerales bacterium]